MPAPDLAVAPAPIDFCFWFQITSYWRDVGFTAEGWAAERRQLRASASVVGSSASRTARVQIT